MTLADHLWLHIERRRAESGSTRSAYLRHLIYEDWQRHRHGQAA